MVNFGIVIVIAVVIGTMSAGMYMYTQYQTNYIESAAGETIIVGPVEYVVTFEGTHNGDKETSPENTFVMIATCLSAV